MSFFKLIKSDFNKYKKYGGHFFSIIFFTQGFWAIFQYRIANMVYKKIHIPIIRQVLLFLLLIWQKTVEIFTGISIPSSVKIGHSFYIGQFGGIVINAKAIIGNNCNISQGVVIGVSGRGEKRGVPIINNNVYIAPNAVIAGKITIGDNSVIGANTLVINDIESNITVIGVPAIKVSNNNSEDYI
jgi:serine O-acetyltransferase